MRVNNMRRNIVRSPIRTAIIVVFTAALIITGCTQRHPTAAPLDEQKVLVAKVNGAGITMRSLHDMMDRMSALDREAASPVPPEEVRRKAMDQLVLQELASQEAARQGLHVKPRDIDAAITYLVGHEQKDYDAFLAKRNETDAEFRSGLEQSMLLQLIIAREVTEKVSVSEDEVRKEYESRKDLFIEPEKVAVVDVMISAKLDNEASGKKAAEIIARIRADKDKNPWSLTPDSDFIVRDLELKKEKEPALYDAARKLKEGELSGVIRTGDGVHIMKLSEYTPERRLSYEEVKGPVEQKLRADALRKRREAWEQELKKGAKIEILDVPMLQERKNP
jgi:parvulin-like peptidyl-prolyl isomerase